MKQKQNEKKNLIIGVCVATVVGILAVIAATNTHGKLYYALRSNCKYVLSEGVTMGSVINCRCFAGCMERFQKVGALKTEWDIEEITDVCMQRCVRI